MDRRQNENAAQQKLGHTPERSKGGWKAEMEGKELEEWEEKGKLIGEWGVDELAGLRERAAQLVTRR